ncbi:unnamed protein product [Caenorhabditis nigoni]
MSRTTKNTDSVPQVTPEVVDEKGKKILRGEIKESVNSLLDYVDVLKECMDLRMETKTDAEIRKEKPYLTIRGIVSNKLRNLVALVKDNIGSAIRKVKEAHSIIVKSFAMIGNTSPDMDLFNDIADGLKDLAELLEKAAEESGNFVWSDNDDDVSDDDEDEPSPKRFKSNDDAVLKRGGFKEPRRGSSRKTESRKRPSTSDDSNTRRRPAGTSATAAGHSSRPKKQAKKLLTGPDQAVSIPSEKSASTSEPVRNPINMVDGELHLSTAEELESQQTDYQRHENEKDEKDKEEEDDNGEEQPKEGEEQQQPQINGNGKEIEQPGDDQVDQNALGQGVDQPDEQERVDPVEKQQDEDDTVLVDYPQPSNAGPMVEDDDLSGDTGYEVPFVLIPEPDFDTPKENGDARIEFGEEGTKQQAKDGDSEGGSIDEENIQEIQDVENGNENKMAASPEIPDANQDHKQDQKQNVDRLLCQPAIRNGPNEEPAVVALPNAEEVVDRDELLEEPNAIAEDDAGQPVAKIQTGKGSAKSGGKKKRKAPKIGQTKKSKKTEVDASQPPRFELTEPNEDDKTRNENEKKAIEEACPPGTPPEDKFTSYQMYGENFNKLLKESYHQLYNESVANHLIVCQNGTEFLSKKDIYKGTRAYKILSIDGLNFKVPDGSLEAVGEKFNKRLLRIFINGREQTVRASLNDMFNQMKNRKEEKSYDSLNLVSQEVSFDKKSSFEQPEFVKKESVLFQCKQTISNNLEKWTKEGAKKNKTKIDMWSNRKNQMAAVEQFIIMSVGGAFMSLHCDMGGTWVYYHVKEGLKVFFIALGTPENLAVYTEWQASKRSQSWILKKLKSELRRVEVRAGESVVLPAGCLHAVYTPEDSLVYAGNYLTADSESMEISFKIRNFEGYSLKRGIIGLESMMPHYWDSWFFFGENLVTEEKTDENARIAAVLVKNLKVRVRTAEGDFFTGEEKGKILNSMIQTFNLNENLLAIEEISTAPEPQRPVNKVFDEDDVYHTDGSVFSEDEEEDPVRAEPAANHGADSEDEMDD